MPSNSTTRPRIAIFAALAVAATSIAAVVTLLRGPPGGTGSGGIDVEFSAAADRNLSIEERSAIEAIAAAAVTEVRSALPLPTKLSLTVDVSENVIPETGTTARLVARDTIRWAVDHTRPEGVMAIAEADLRPTLFHELHHVVRLNGGVPRATLLAAAIDEGLATAFARDFAGYEAPWGDPPAEISIWVNELLGVIDMPMREAAENGTYQKWFFEHPDGRRWIGYRVGTHIVDEAMKNTGLDTAGLVTVPAQQIFDSAELD